MYQKKGQMRGNVSNIVGLVVGVGVASLVIIFIGALGGQTYNQVQGKICDLNQAASDGNGGGEQGCTEGIGNYNIALDIREGIQSSFGAISTSGQYLPIIVLAVVIFVVLGLVVNMGRGSGGYSAGAL